MNPKHGGKAISALFNSATQSLCFWFLFFYFFRHVALTQKEDRINIAMISNDNAFLNTYQTVPSPFMQRTLLTRLGDPDYDPIMIPKPIFHLWTLFSLQGIVFWFFFFLRAYNFSSALEVLRSKVNIFLDQSSLLLLVTLIGMHIALPF